MTASDLAILAFASCFACGCAEGYAAVSSMSEASTIAPAAGIGGLGGAGGTGGAAGEMPAGGMGGMGVAPVPMGDPCTRNDMAPCPCEGSDAQGVRRCLFDMASPTQGSFSECMGCPAPMPAASCTDGAQNGAETSADCGGADCEPCALGSACLVDGDCAAAMCIASVCTMPPASGGTGGGDSGSGGSSGEGGESGSSGTGGEPPIDEPVEDCEGVPEGTECDRDCILPGNTATCNSRGDCSCL